MSNSSLHILPSLLDRLVDRQLQDPVAPRGPETYQSELMRLRRSVQRDLEALLNTRNTFHSPRECRQDPCPCVREHVPEEFALASKSILTFGLPDFSKFDAGNLHALEAAIKLAIERFEPRLTDVTATLVELNTIPTPGTRSKAVTNAIVRVSLTARLKVTKEELCFDVVMSSTGSTCEIRET